MPRGKMGSKCSVQLTYPASIKQSQASLLFPGRPGHSLINGFRDGWKSLLLTGSRDGSSILEFRWREC